MELAKNERSSSRMPSELRRLPWVRPSRSKCVCPADFTPRMFQHAGAIIQKRRERVACQTERREAVLKARRDWWSKHGLPAKLKTP